MYYHPYSVGSMLFISFTVFFAFLWVGTLYLLRREENQSRDLKEEVNHLKLKIAYEEEKRSDHVEYLEQKFKALSSDLLQNNSNSFLDLAMGKLEQLHERSSGTLHLKHKEFEQLVDPLKVSLAKVDEKISELEKARSSAYASITEQLKGVALTNAQLYSETGKLTSALRAPTVRGRWGEIQLRKVVEMAGMVEYCDFFEQKTIEGENSRIRPDLVISLPNDKKIVIDSKTPLEGYLKSLDTSVTHAQRVDALKEHASQVRAQVLQLSSKSYWSQFDRAPEFVVLFLPGETFFSAALEQDPSLIEFGVDRRVILATPTTLIALLRSVAYGWSEMRLAENAAQISSLGKELHARLGKFSAYFGGVKKGLENATNAYNQAVGSFESRVMVTARKFEDLGVNSKETLPYIEPIDLNVRKIDINL